MKPTASVSYELKFEMNSENNVFIKTLFLEFRAKFKRSQQIFDFFYTYFGLKKSDNPTTAIGAYDTALLVGHSNQEVVTSILQAHLKYIQYWLKT